MASESAARVKLLVHGTRLGLREYATKHTRRLTRTSSRYRAFGKAISDTIEQRISAIAGGFIESKWSYTKREYRVETGGDNGSSTRSMGYIGKASLPIELLRMQLDVPYVVTEENALLFRRDRLPDILNESFGPTRSYADRAGVIECWPQDTRQARLGVLDDPVLRFSTDREI